MDVSNEKIIPKTIMGLQNMGNTCYINSCLQVLLRIPELNWLLEQENFTNRIKEDAVETIITTQWKELRDIMCCNEGIMRPNQFLHNMREMAKKNPMYEMFSGIEQNDTPEFFTFIIECIHKSVSREVIYRLQYDEPKTAFDKIKLACLSMKKKVNEKEYSELVDLFYGIQLTKIVSEKMIVESLRPEMCFWMSLPIVNYNNDPFDELHECIQWGLQPEKLEGENAWYNEKTKQTENVQLIKSYWCLPSILCINLNRFSLDGSTKLTNEVNFPVNNLDMSPYVEGDNPEQYQYELFAVVNHMGGLNDGHYTVFIKHSDMKWYHINDERIQEVGNVLALTSSLAYCLFYRKKNE